MSKIVMISGSRSIQQLPAAAIESINRIIELKFEIIIGDAPGIDTLVLDYLRSQGYRRVQVYYALFNGNGKPRHRRGYTAIGISGNYTDRDKQMCYIADYGLAVWDGRSKGTKANIDRVKKTKVIFVN
ncbi:hypothetical protein ACE1CD_15485 [Aerosakkonema sp. BLCC-F183]|uniref:hypothetical protein n=1 Tax=Aerosakkonema sp. BLCC-F183 TaxID=3342834 RepID=UPI0035B824A2